MYTGLGEKEEAQRARENMLELRDSLRSYAISEDLHQIEMKRERRDMQERMALAEYRAREKDRWLAGITVFALVILYLLLRIRKSNRRLRLTLTDATGNKCVQTISPALYAESAKSGVAGVKEDAFGISLQGNTLFISSADAAAVEIYSISGTLVKQATGNEIDLSALPAGVYVVRAAAAGSVVTEKICVR